MATAFVLLPSQNIVTKRSSPRFSIYVNADHPTDRKTYTFPYGPTNIVLDSLANTYSTIERPGKPPLFVMSGRALPTLSFTLTLAYWVLDTDIQTYIMALRQIAGGTSHVTFSYPSIDGYWRCSACTVTTTQLTTGNKSMRATVDMTFTRVSDPATNVGPVSGGVKVKPVHRAPARTKTTKTKAVAVYTVRSDDTLWGIALRHYGDPHKYTMIAEYNHISNPNRIYVGQRIKLP